MAFFKFVRRGLSTFAQELPKEFPRSTTDIDFSPFVTMKEHKADLMWIVLTGFTIAGGAVTLNQWSTSKLIGAVEKVQLAHGMVLEHVNTKMKDVKIEVKEVKLEVKELERKMKERFDTMEGLLKTLVEKKK